MLLFKKKVHIKMNQGNSVSARTESNAKKQKSTKKCDENENAAVADAVVVDIAPTKGQTGDIFKLNLDCFEEAFDYSSVRDLISIGKTCKYLQNVAGHRFRRNYSNLRIKCRSDGVVIATDADYSNINHFAEFIRGIRIDGAGGLLSILDGNLNFRRLEQLQVYSLEMMSNEIDAMIGIWSKLKDLQMLKLRNLNGNYHVIIDHCVNLKRLEVIWSGIDYNWVVRRYPTLETLLLIPPACQSFDQLAELLMLNPNIRRFVTTPNCLMENRVAMKTTTDINLDDLAISFDFHANYSVATLCELLNELHERGVYKRVHLFFYEITTQNTIYQLTTVNGLDSLFIYKALVRFELPELRSLVELCVYKKSSKIDLDHVLDELVNLKRIYFCFSHLDDIIPFIQRSASLERIRVDCLRYGPQFNENTKVIDLPTLNRLRQQLPGARKITFYVREDVYLATKWTLKTTDFPLICLKRNESFRWDNDFICDFKYHYDYLFV